MQSAAITSHIALTGSSRSSAMMASAAAPRTAIAAQSSLFLMDMPCPLICSRRLHVRVQPEKVPRVVLLLERRQASVVVAVGGVYARLAIVGGGQVDVLSVGLRLDLLPGTSHPVAP